MSRRTWLKERRGLTDLQIDKTGEKLSNTLDYKSEENLEPKIIWLQERLALDDKSLSTLFQDPPRPPRTGFEYQGQP